MATLAKIYRAGKPRLAAKQEHAQIANPSQGKIICGTALPLPPMTATLSDVQPIRVVPVSDSDRSV